MVVTLLKALVANDPANADFYKANARKLVLDLAELSREIRAEFAPFAGLRVVTFHKAWGYFADAVPIEITDTIEQQVMITPSPRQVRQVIERMRAAGVKVVVCETWDDQNLAQFVAGEAGAKMVVLPNQVKGVPAANSYQELFRYNVRRLIETAKAAGVDPRPAAAADTQSASPAGAAVPKVSGTDGGDTASGNYGGR
jgi:ABC-type Zn uptake system ZnuABC Zn-binding protein ZnuA